MRIGCLSKIRYGLSAEIFRIMQLLRNHVQYNIDATAFHQKPA